MKKWLNKLKKMKDKKYAEFQAKLMPTVDKKIILGVRTPALKKLAKDMLNDKDEEIFLDELPHKYFDENQLHAFILSEMKNYDTCINRVNEFLPYIDNWATCDQLSPKCFKKNKEILFKHISKWIKSKKPYVIRFAIRMIMCYFLDEDFDEKYLKMVSDIDFKSNQKRQVNFGEKSSRMSKIKLGKSEQSKIEKISIDIDSNKYYVEMMRAWFFATALAKQYNATFPYIKNIILIAWTHNKTIQKACESYRVSIAHKNELKKYKI